MKSPLASLLWRSLRVYQVFGANTDVGKTIFTTLLARTAKKLWKDENVAFLKPVSTGPEDEADDRCESLCSLILLECRESVTNNTSCVDDCSLNEPDLAPQVTSNFIEQTCKPVCTRSSPQHPLPI